MPSVAVAAPIRTSTSRYQAERSNCATPHASSWSVLLRCACSAVCMWRSPAVPPAGQAAAGRCNARMTPQRTGPSGPACAGTGLSGLPGLGSSLPRRSLCRVSRVPPAWRSSRRGGLDADIRVRQKYVMAVLWRGLRRDRNPVGLASSGRTAARTGTSAVIARRAGGAVSGFTVACPMASSADSSPGLSSRATTRAGEALPACAWQSPVKPARVRRPRGGLDLRPQRWRGETGAGRRQDEGR